MLVRKGVKDLIPRAANEVEAMRGADPASGLAPKVAMEFVLPVLITDDDEDATAAQSAHAQAMLQLLQEPPCDMGIQLPYSALETVTGAPSDAVLGAVLIGKARFGGDGQFRWESTILAGKAADQSAVDVVGGASEAWRCLALARRYEQYGCRVFATKDAIAECSYASAFFERRDAVDEAVTLANARHAFPRMQTVNESRAIATEAREKFLWRPFAAATADDVPVADEENATEGGDEKR